MPGRVYEADLTVAAGTLQAAPAVMTWSIQTGTVEEIELIVPTGHNGLTGVRVKVAGTPVIPFQGAAWLVANNYDKAWAIWQEVNQGQLVVEGYNLDQYPHTFYLRALAWPLDSRPRAAATGLTGQAAAGAAAAAAIAGLSRPGDLALAPAGEPAAPVSRALLGRSSLLYPRPLTRA